MDFAARRKAVGKGAIAGIIVVIIVIAAVAVYYAAITPSSSSTSGGTSTVTSTVTSTGVSTVTSTGVSTVTSTSVSTVTSSSSSTTSATTTLPHQDTLVIDDVFYTIGQLNQLNAIYAIPFPNWLTYTVYQSIVTLNGTALQNTGELQYVPMLADDWTVSSDGLTYTFHLRDAKFSSGNPLNSYQVWAQMYGLYYLSANSTYWFLDYPVFDMQKSHFGPSTIALLQKTPKTGLINPDAQLLAIMQDQTWPIYVTDSSHIVFHLVAPFNYFLGCLVVFQSLIFDTQWALDNGGFGTPAQFNTFFNEHPIPGTGPYVVTAVSTNAFVKFAKNPNYWGAGLTPAQVKANKYLDPGHVQNVLVQVRTDDIARYTELSSGRAAIATILDQNWPLIINNPDRYGYVAVPANSMLINGIAMNTLRYPTNNVAVRQAIVHAINYSNINVKVYGGGLYSWNGPTYPAWKDFYNLGNGPIWPYDVNAAKKILADANIDPSKLPTLEFRVLAGCTFCINTAQLVQADLGLIGINVNLEVTPSASYGTPLIAGPTSFDISAKNNATESHLTWLGAFTFAPGADTPADPWLGWVNGKTPANNWAIYYNPVVQKCVDGWTSIADQNELKSLCTAAQLQINQDAPYVWLGSLKLVVGSGSVVWDKKVISSVLLDPVYTGQSDTVIFNTVEFVNGQ